MNQKYTFGELCEAYQKTEIPIIQRDYAQGRNTEDVKRIRTKFIEEYLLPSIVAGNPVELDFVYGSVVVETKNEAKYKTFVPLDGQQRLTTLFLLYFIVALKEGRLADIKEVLGKFTYETRPSAHDFCRLLLEVDTIKDIRNIVYEITNAAWFNNEWLTDPTVSGMLNVLGTLASSNSLLSAPVDLLDKLLDKENKLISFYFTDLESFGLTESLYIRMNARGKMLTEFENFKSEFFKIIRYSPELLEQVKTKIEYEWVENLWPYKADGSYVIDDPFMRYLRYITEMLYYKDAPFRSPVSDYETDFLSFRVLRNIYSIEENLRFLIFSLDQLKQLSSAKFAASWANEKLISLRTVLADIIGGSSDIDRSIILFSALLYYKSENPEQHLADYVRVVRNLIVNTEDNSRREWPRLMSSVQSLISYNNVYVVLADKTKEITLIGFNVSQRNEEVYKASLIRDFPEVKIGLFQMEDHSNFKGNITNLLKAPFAKKESEYASIKLDTLVYDKNQLRKLKNIFEAYNEISKQDFNPIWGNLLITGLYEFAYESRLVYSGNFKKHPAILLFAKQYQNSNLSLEEFIIKLQKDFVNKLKLRHTDFSNVRSVKEQLYIYYIIHEKVYGKTYASFFKDHNFNFGWLAKENGFKSHFNAGIEGSGDFENDNPIFQLYNSQFRYNSGINPANTLDIETIGGGKKRDPFKTVIDWAAN